MCARLRLCATNATQGPRGVLAGERAVANRFLGPAGPAEDHFARTWNLLRPRLCARALGVAVVCFAARGTAKLAAVGYRGS